MSEWLEDGLALLLGIAGCLIVEHRFRRRWPALAEAAGVRPGMTALLILLAVVAIDLGEDAIAGTSSGVDRELLLRLHALVPDAFVPYFSLATMTASWYALVPGTVVLTLLMFARRRRSEAVLLAATATAAALSVYLMKSVVDRQRPALWPTEYDWGSSFPSGHTLVATAIAVCLVFCLGRIAPRAQPGVLAIALAWAGLVGLSRLVLGVHWPTDVAAAWCVGAVIALLACGTLRVFELRAAVQRTLRANN
ncbi:undecaprenyl-diphosphatase [Tahibacter aquaticus]|uniref:undecaprenyl-diphosphate phosphatase n=1 Tax=Tahibacter aquaticus TaxID=520092 RepID=A0A4V3DMR8_9GAMM|nr:phosphatase PAP2 family protein [Tahibacter aquaticus]TDR45676.1 undecaprenyl-diphosphatase [Tahibacter aquaticus]